MKKLLLAIVSLVCILVVAALIVPFLIPMDTYKKEIIARVKEATGRDLAIDGPIKVTLFPVAGINLEKVSFSNPEGYTGKQLFTAQAVTLQVEALPLLSKEIIVKRFIFAYPVIDFEIAKNGKPNWEMQLAPAAALEPQPQGVLVSSAIAAEQPRDFLSGLRLADVQIQKGQMSYRDLRTGVNQQVTDIDLKMSLDNVDSPLKAVALFTWNKELVRIEAVMNTLRQWLQGDETQLQAGVKSGDVLLQFNGKGTMSGNYSGDVVFESPSLSRLANWTGSPMGWKATPLQFATKGALTCTAKQCNLGNASIALDNLKLNGDLSLMLGAAVPTLKAKLVGDTLDLNPYLAAPVKQSSLFISDAFAATGWDDTPIDLKGLRAVNADIDLNVAGLLINKIKLGKTMLGIKLSGGRLVADVPNVELYGGNGNGQIVVDASGGVPTLQKRFSLKNIDAQPLLTDAADFDRLSGRMEQQIDVRTSGTTQRQWVSGMSGSGSVKFTDGSLRGLNIASMVRDIKSGFGGAVNEDQKTDFAELGGTYTIANGIVTNKDLAMKAPLVRVKGEGNVDLPQQRVNYRITPELVNSLKGQGGTDKSGIAIPVIVEGTFDKLTFRPDVGSVAQDVMNNPEKYKETLKDAKEQLKEMKKDGKKIDADQIKGLLKGLGGR